MQFKKVKFDELRRGKLYYIIDKNLYFSDMLYQGEVVYKSKSHATLRVTLNSKPRGAFGTALPYNVGVMRNDVDFENASVTIYE